MPDYGSSLTSALYIRGIGSRINTPAVGLYVDNIPYICLLYTSPQAVRIKL